MAKLKAPKSRHWRIGFALGWMLRTYMRNERKLRAWLMKIGVGAKASLTLIWVVKLSFWAVFLYLSYWAATVAIAWWVIKGLAELSIPVVRVHNAEHGWRYGHQGFGYYCGEYRIDHGERD